jgi:gamma-aminobutyric acid type B receptor
MLRFLVSLFVLGAASPHEDKVLHLLGLIPNGVTAWPAGPTILLSMEIALEQINNRQDVLEGYKLELVWGDTEV